MDTGQWYSRMNSQMDTEQWYRGMDRWMDTGHWCRRMDGWMDSGHWTVVQKNGRMDVILDSGIEGLADVLRD